MVEKNSINFSSSDFDITLGVFELDAAVLKSVSTDAGSATPASHTITIAGTNGITTDAVGDVVTLTASGGSSDYVFISSATANNSASISFTGLSSTYFAYIVVIDALVPITDATTLRIRTSTDNGANYDAGASDYNWTSVSVDTASASAKLSDISDSEIELNNVTGTQANEKINLLVTIYNPSSTKLTTIQVDGTHYSSTPAGLFWLMQGCRISAADVDAIQFIMSSGNISSGVFKLYGVVAS